MTAALCTCAAIMTLSACNSSKEVSFQSGGVKQTFASGHEATDEAFPLPMYPAAQPSGSVGSQGDANDNSKFLMLTSQDAVSKIGDFYEAEMKKEGWNIVSLNTLPSMINISAEKDNLEGSVMVTGDGENTTIKLQVGNKVEGVPSPSTAPNATDQLNPPTD